MNSFKPGDWVIHGKDLHRVLLVDIDETNGSYMCIVNIPYFRDTWLPQSKFKLWQPKVGEWCWFWNRDKPNKTKLKQLYSINYEHDVHWTYKTIDCKTYQHCEPFIGQLPTNLKDLS